MAFLGLCWVAAMAPARVAGRNPLGGNGPACVFSASSAVVWCRCAAMLLASVNRRLCIELAPAPRNKRVMIEATGFHGDE